MPEWPKNRKIIGTSVPRLDGALKVSGKAKYSYDRVFPGLLHAKILRSPHAHAKITSIDLAPAETAAGVKAVLGIKAAGAELRYVGDEIAAVAAETEEQARDATRAIKIEYEILPHVVTEEEGLKKADNPKPQEQGQGNVDEALRNAAAKIEGFYGSPVITHMCMESHGLTAQWKGENEFVVYCSTQNVTGVGGEAKGRVKNPNIKATCETPFMGGGFGSKFGSGVEGNAAMDLSIKTKRPVKLMLERAEEQNSGGNRPSLYAKVKAGADKDGKLVAFDADCYGTGGYTGGPGQRLPYIYVTTTRRVKTQPLPTNCGQQRAWRAPGSPQASLIMEQVMDDLADKLNMDPIEFRLLNLTGPLKPIYEKEFKIGAERIGWNKRHPRGDKAAGAIKRGMGFGLSTWGGGPHDSQATATIHPDGRVEVRCGTQDLGTGTITLVAIVAAEILGLQVKDVTPLIGSSEYPKSGGSGGSTTVGGVSLAVAMACKKALAELFKKAAPELGAEPAELEAAGGKIGAKGKSLTWKQACALLGQQPIEVSGAKSEAPPGMANQGVGGVQFADVSVDVETGVAKVNKIVAVADCGLVMNRLLCESQVYGAVVMGINHGLFEERRMDERTGRFLNVDLETYRLARHSDIGEIDVQLLDYPERGVIGIGEPPAIPTAAAIANAVCNAIGVRVGVVPLTPKRIMDALK